MTARGRIDNAQLLTAIGRTWGRTGRVTLKRSGVLPDLIDVFVDGVFAVGLVNDLGWAKAYGYPAPRPGTCNNKDAAVMWVLRHYHAGVDDIRTRAVRDAWRAERQHVWRVFSVRSEAIPGLCDAGWAWFAAPTDEVDNPIGWLPLAAGSDTPDKGDRAWIRHRAHARATADYQEASS